MTARSRIRTVSTVLALICAPLTADFVAPHAAKAVVGEWSGFVNWEGRSVTVNPMTTTTVRDVELIDLRQDDPAVVASGSRLAITEGESLCGPISLPFSRVDELTAAPQPVGFTILAPPTGEPGSFVFDIGPPALSATVQIEQTACGITTEETVENATFAMGSNPNATDTLPSGWTSFSGSATYTTSAPGTETEVTTTWRLTRLPDCDHDGIPNVEDTDETDPACGPNLIIEQQLVPPESPVTFEFEGAVSGSLADDQTLEERLSPGQYSVTQRPGPEGWTLVDISCGLDADSSGDVATRTATVNLSAGETVRCVFTNHFAIDARPRLSRNGITWRLGFDPLESAGLRVDWRYDGLDAHIVDWEFLQVDHEGVSSLYAAYPFGPPTISDGPSGDAEINQGVALYVDSRESGTFFHALGASSCRVMNASSSRGYRWVNCRSPP